MAAHGIAIASPSSTPKTEPVAEGRTTLSKILLACGIASSLLYVAMNVFVPTTWPGYNSASQVVSELSAVDAPSRPLWVVLGMVWALLVTAFGWGVWASARGNRPLRILGGVLIACGLFNIVPWPPMHQREVLAAGGGSLTDTLHIVWSMVAVVFMVLAIGFGAAALGKRFRFYSIATMVMLIGFGVLTGIDAPRIDANLPTPWIGVWERINIGVYDLWVVVLSIALLRRNARAAGAR